MPCCWAALGYGGNGTTYSRIAADVICGALTGRPDVDADLLSFEPPSAILRHAGLVRPSRLGTHCAHLSGCRTRPGMTGVLRRIDHNPRRAPAPPGWCGGARGTPRSPARRWRPRSPDRPSAAARRSSRGSAPCRHDPRRRWSSSRGWARIRRPRCPARAGISSATPRACPSLSVAAALVLTKVFSTAASAGPNSSITRDSPSWICTSRAASSALSAVITEPEATNIRRLPSTSITPQPVRRRPGSMPRMRIGRPMRLIAPPGSEA